MKRGRSGISADSEFTADEIEVANIIILFCHQMKQQMKLKLFLQWGAKRRRSPPKRFGIQRRTHNSEMSTLNMSVSEKEHGGIQKDENSGILNSELSPFNISASNNEQGGMAMVPAPPLARSLLSNSSPNSKDVKVKNRTSKRASKKKTHKELTGMVHELSSENAILMKEVEKTRKRRQDLKDCNVHLKAQLALCLAQHQEENTLYTSQPSPSHSNTGQKTEVSALSDNFQSLDEHGNFENYSGTSALSSAYDKLQRLGRVEEA